ncbi:MAG: TlpA disulfide reductase family protein [Magnetospirillum sp.]|nr:TlpA disulfide reductase family protein [Magnetospirillum sp.]
MRVSLWFLAALAGLLPAVAPAAEPAPPLVVTELNGQSFDLGALRGKVVVVNFFASWCPPCREEMPALSAFYRDYRARGVEVIGLSADRERDRADVLAISRGIGYPMAMLRDATENGFGMPNALPAAYLIDAKGFLRGEIVSEGQPITEDRLAAAVLPLLPAGPPASPGGDNVPNR